MQIKFVVVVDNLFVLTFPFVIFVVYLWGLMRGANVEENIKKGNSIYSFLFLSNPAFLAPVSSVAIKATISFRHSGAI